MCGIAGVIHLDNRLEKYPVGLELMTMSQCLQHRGADSAGVALFNTSAKQTSIQVTLPPGHVLPEPQLIDRISENCLTALRFDHGGFAATLSPRVDGIVARQALIERIESGLPGAVVTSVGGHISVFKTVGSASGLSETVLPLQGTHGIAHLRLATESKIDPAHAQPFWGRPYDDIAVTHNGHITNYYKLRQKLEARGFSFASKNDSEIIGILIGESIANGALLSEALPAVAAELDGSYSFIVATSLGLGVARDPFATKPLLFVETESIVAIASEQQALHRLLGESLTIQEIEPKECRTWEKA